MSNPERPWTAESLDWLPWVSPVRVGGATPAQAEALRENGKLGDSPYSRVLAHDPEALRQRTRLFNAVMYAPRGLPRADRELATLAVSRVNGCVYCASVHARRFVELSKQPEIVQGIFDDGLGTPLNARRRAIVDYADALTSTPPRKDTLPRSGAALRGAGLSDLEILDLTHAVAMFHWANRLMQTLGEPAAPASTSRPPSEA